MTRPPPLAALLGVVAVGGALGALLRWSTEQLVPDGAGFPWTTLAINVVGALALGLLPLLTASASSPLVLAALGPGVLGGFTTMSAAAEQTRRLLGEGHLGSAGLYLVGTLTAALVAVETGRRLGAGRTPR